MNDYYVYVHRRASDNLPFYVGKGKGRRAWQITGKSRNPHWHKVNKKHGLIVELVFENLTEEESFDLEKNTILEFSYFGFPLTNMSSGGEGNSGLQFTDEQRLRISDNLKSKRYFDKVRKPIDVKRPSAYGDKNHFADKKPYTFIRLSDGFEVTCNRHELCSEFGVNRDIIKKLFYTIPRKSADGWKLKKD